MKNIDKEKIDYIPDYVKNWDVVNPDLPDEKYEIAVHFSPNTCPACGKMDGSHFFWLKRRIGKNFPPFHDGCTCMVVPYVNVEYHECTKAAKNIFFKTVYVPRDLSFEEYNQLYLIEHLLSDLQRGKKYHPPTEMKSECEFTCNGDVQHSSQNGVAEKHNYSHIGNDAKILSAFHDDYVKLVFLWTYSLSPIFNSIEDYRSSIFFECGITDPIKFHHLLVQEGYLQVAGGIDILTSLKADDLKQLCKKTGISPAGTKHQMAKKLLTCLTPDEVKMLRKDTIYVLSTKGHDFVDAHSDYLYLHKNNFIDIRWKDIEFLRYEAEPIEEFVKRVLYHRIKNDASYGICSFDKLAKLYNKEKNFSEELHILLHLLFLASNGVNDGVPCLLNHYYDIRYDIHERADRFNAKTDLVLLKDFLYFKRIHDLQEYFSESMIKEIFKTSIPYTICPEDIFRNLIESIFLTCSVSDGILKRITSQFHALRCALPMSEEWKSTDEYIEKSFHETTIDFGEQVERIEKQSQSTLGMTVDIFVANAEESAATQPASFQPVNTQKGEIVVKKSLFHKILSFCGLQRENRIAKHNNIEKTKI